MYRQFGRLPDLETLRSDMPAYDFLLLFLLGLRLVEPHGLWLMCLLDIWFEALASAASTTGIVRFLNIVVFAAHGAANTCMYIYICYQLLMQSFRIIFNIYI